MTCPSCLPTLCQLEIVMHEHNSSPSRPRASMPGRSERLTSPTWLLIMLDETWCERRTSNSLVQLPLADLLIPRREVLSRGHQLLGLREEPDHRVGRRGREVVSAAAGNRDNRAGPQRHGRLGNGLHELGFCLVNYMQLRATHQTTPSECRPRPMRWHQSHRGRPKRSKQRKCGQRASGQVRGCQTSRG